MFSYKLIASAMHWTTGGCQTETTAMSEFTTMFMYMYTRSPLVMWNVDPAVASPISTSVFHHWAILQRPVQRQTTISLPIPRLFCGKHCGYRDSSQAPLNLNINMYSTDPNSMTISPISVNFARQTVYLPCMILTLKCL